MAFNLKLNLISAIILRSISLFVLIDFAFQKQCPDYEVLSPCYCHSKIESSRFCANNGTEESHYCQIPVISCAGDQAFNLSDVFFRVSQTIAIDQRFQWLYLSNSAITRLEADTLGGIRFDNVYIRHSSSLKTIDPMAFGNSSQFVKHIWINATKLSDKVMDKRNAFKAISSLTNLKTFEVISSRFTSIPSLAFSNRSSIRTISFHNYNERQFLKRVNSKAFYKLSDLKRIDLRNNRISRINSFAFSFETESNHTLRIHLENNYLRSDSFSPKAFIGSNGRRVVLYLGAYNQCNADLKTLDREVFEPFLAENKRNAIELYGCAIECDDRVLWMERPRSLLKRRIRHVRCVPDIVLNRTLAKSSQEIRGNAYEEQAMNNRSVANRVKKMTKSRPQMGSKPKKKLKSESKKNEKKGKRRMTLKERLGIIIS